MSIDSLLKEMLVELEQLTTENKIEQLNLIRERLHQISPFVTEPIDFVKWVKTENVEANNYNPNKVASPEMELLYTSIKNNGIGMPVIVGKQKNRDFYTIVDGFHRHATITNRKDINKRVLGYIPISILNKNEPEMIAATVEFNRARGKHQVELMANLVSSLASKGWNNTQIAECLGMEAEEILRLRQLKGIAEVLSNAEYSRSWEVRNNGK